MAEVTLTTDYQPSLTQIQAHNTRARWTLYGGGEGGGKEAALDSLVLTPFGFRQMGDVKVDSQVSCPDGHVARVIGVYPQGIKDIYRFTFDDGATCEVGLEHLWKVRERDARRYKKWPAKDVPVLWKLATTRQLIEKLKQDKTVYIPLAEPVPFTVTSRFPDGRWPLDPYVLGALLGDGHLGNSIVLTVDDPEIPLRFLQRGVEINTISGSGERCPAYTCLGIMEGIRSLGIHHLRSWEKFIPDAYKVCPLPLRIALMQGLMDTDGYVDDRGHCSYTTTSPQLARDVQWLARSLGFKAAITPKSPIYSYKGEKLNGRLAYTVWLTGRSGKDIVTLSRKLSRVKEPWYKARRIESIESSRRAEAQCIAIDHPDGLYLTDDFIVTHNTRWAVEEIVRLMMKYPGIEGIAGRFDQNTVFEPTQIYDLFHKCCPPELIPAKGGEYRSYPRWTRFHNGSRVTWTGFKDYSLSSEFGFAFIDQAEEVKEETLRLTDGRLRQRLPDGRFPHFRMGLTCNPHPNIEWFLKMVEQYPEDYVFIKSLHSDNKFLPEDFVEVRRRSYSDEYFKRLIEGSWDAFAGQAISEFDTNIHRIDPFDTWQVMGWPVYLGIDFGTSAPTAAEWVTVSPDGILFVIQEYDRENTSPEVNAKAILNLCRGMRIRGVWIDPRTTMEKVDMNRNLSWSVFDEYKKYFPTIRLANKKREHRLAAWKQVLRPSMELVHYRTCLSPAPRLYIFNTCKNLLHTLPRLQYQEVELGHDPDDITKSNDHWFDAGAFVLTHLLKTTTPYYQIRDIKVKMVY